MLQQHWYIDSLAEMVDEWLLNRGRYGILCVYLGQRKLSVVYTE